MINGVYMSKKLCKNGKENIKKNKAKYECKKCGLYSKKEKKLCKPVEL